MINFTPLIALSKVNKKVENCAKNSEESFFKNACMTKNLTIQMLELNFVNIYFFYQFKSSDIHRLQTAAKNHKEFA